MQQPAAPAAPPFIIVADNNMSDPFAKLALNFSDGISEKFTLDFINHLQKNEGVKRAHERRKADGLAAQGRFKQCLQDTRLTSGAMYKCSMSVLAEDIIDIRHRQVDKANAKELDVVINAVKSFKSV